ncbi:MAG: NAD(P)H-binding protein, partial [Bacteroidota bacterium]
MNLIVFGATGQVGMHLIQQAIWKGHHVKAFGRNVFSLTPEHEQLEKIKGSVFDRNEITNALLGCDAVLSV